MLTCVSSLDCRDQRGMNVNTVKYFLVICEERSFCKAAAVNGISQPSLSMAIQRLERELGGALLNRSRNGVSLTELGRELLPIFRKLVRSADQACSRAAVRRSMMPPNTVATSNPLVERVRAS